MVKTVEAFPTLDMGVTKEPVKKKAAVVQQPQKKFADAEIEEPS